MSTAALSLATRRNANRTPSFRLHKPTGQGFVELDGHRHYLGRYDHPETREKYFRVVAEWLSNGRQLRAEPKEVTVAEVIAAYWEHCQTYYKRPDGTPSARTLGNVQAALGQPRKLYGSVRAVEFGPLALRVCREAWIAGGMCRVTVNMRVAVVKQAFKWAASCEMIPAAVFQALSTLDGLRKGRSKAKESRIVTAVADAHVDAIKDHVSRQVWGMIQLQRHTGARSGEIIGLRRCDLDTSGPIWIARLREHKSGHRGKARVLCFGAQAQAVLREFFVGKGPVDFLFSPRDAERERYAACRTHRHQPVIPPDTDRTLGQCYTSQVYGRAIRRAVKECNEERKTKNLALVPHWHPHQLRHAFGTRVRRQFGLEGAQVALGHADAKTSEIYAEIDTQRAAQIAAAIG